MRFLVFCMSREEGLTKLSSPRIFLEVSKVIAIFFEVVLLVSSLSTQYLEGTNEAYTLFLSLFSMSFSAEVAMFDEGLPTKYKAGPRWLKNLVKVAVACTIALLCASFLLMSIYGANTKLNPTLWTIIAFVLFFLLMPRFFLYAILCVRIIKYGDRRRRISQDYTDEMLRRFGNR
jgi:hypothetical protein